MSDLLDFQRDFAAAISEPATGGLAVYRNTVLHGAVEALRANFPVVEQILGPGMFSRVAVDHAAQCPPRRPVLALYGSRFPDWLEEQSWASDLPYLADVARTERLHVESLMAADAEPHFAIDDRCVRLHPATRFDWLPSPAVTIWLAHQEPLTADLELEWHAEGVLFTRPTPLRVRPMRIDRAAHRLLFGLRLGEPLSTCLGAVARLYPDADAEQLLRGLAEAGAFALPDRERSLP